jgi:DNA uptake protein ComE-like DNA-binding protein
LLLALNLTVSVFEIVLPNESLTAPALTTTSNRFDKTVHLLELNTVDSLALLDLPGIGPWFAFKILNYRARLGGFQRKEQLLEVRGMDTLRYRQIENRLTVDPFEIQKLDVNKAPQEALSQHPYVGFLLAKMLVNYRLQHGNFKRLEEIKTLPLVDADLYSKLAPYLSLFLSRFISAFNLDISLFCFTIE